VLSELIRMKYDVSELRQETVVKGDGCLCIVVKPFICTPHLQVQSLPSVRVYKALAQVITLDPSCTWQMD